MREMKNILSLFALLLTFVGCHKDELPYTSGTEVTDGIKLEIDFSSDFGSKTVAVRSTASTITTDLERVVEAGESCVYVFEHPEGSLNDVTATLATAKLLQFKKIETEKSYIILGKDIANSAVIYGVSNITADLLNKSIAKDDNGKYTLTFGEFKAMQQYTLENLILKKGVDGVNGVLPRHSTPLTVASLTDKNIAQRPIKIDFSYARIDVMMTASDDTVIESIQGIKVPSNRLDGTTRLPLSHIVTSETNSGTGQFPDDITDANHSTKYVQGLYIYPTPIDITDRNKPVYILIKAKQTASQLEGRYYKLLFRYEKIIGSKNYSYNVERAVRYLIKIGSLNSPGYLTSDDAIKAPPSNISYEIVIDDKTLNFASNGQYYIGTDRSVYTLPSYVNVDDMGFQPSTLTVDQAQLEIYNWKLVGDFWQFDVIFNYHAGKDSNIKAGDLPSKMVHSDGNMELIEVKKEGQPMGANETWEGEFGEYTFTFQAKDINVQGDYVEFTVGELYVKVERIQFASRIVVDDSGMVNGWADKSVKYTTPDKTDNWTAKVTFPSAELEWDVDYGASESPAISTVGLLKFTVKPQFPRADDHHLFGTLVLTSTLDLTNVITVPIEFSSEHVLAQATDKASVNGHVYLESGSGATAKKMYVYDRNVGAPEISRANPVAKYFTNSNTTQNVEWRGEGPNATPYWLGSEVENKYTVSGNGLWRPPTQDDLNMILGNNKELVNERYYISSLSKVDTKKTIYTFFPMVGFSASFGTNWKRGDYISTSKEGTYYYLLTTPRLGVDFIATVSPHDWEYGRSLRLVQTVTDNTISIRSDQADNTQLILEDFGEDQFNILTVTTTSPKYKVELINDDQFHTRAAIKKSGLSGVYGTADLILNKDDKIEFKLNGGAYPRAESDDPKTKIRVTQLMADGVTTVDSPVVIDITINSKHILAAPTAPNDGLYPRIDMGTYWMEVDDRNRGAPEKSTSPTAKYFGNQEDIEINKNWKGSYTTRLAESVKNTFVTDNDIPTSTHWRIPNIHELSKLTDNFSNYQHAGFINSRYYIRSNHPDPDKSDVYVYIFLPLAGNSTTPTESSGRYMSTHVHNKGKKDMGNLLLKTTSAESFNSKETLGISVRLVRTVKKNP